MTKTQALKIFKPVIQDDCPTCEAKKGELCDTSALWVHLARIQKVNFKGAPAPAEGGVKP